MIRPLLQLFGAAFGAAYGALAGAAGALTVGDLLGEVGGSERGGLYAAMSLFAIPVVALVGCVVGGFSGWRLATIAVSHAGKATNHQTTDSGRARALGLTGVVCIPIFLMLNSVVTGAFTDFAPLGLGATRSADGAESLPTAVGIGVFVASVLATIAIGQWIYLLFRARLRGAVAGNRSA